MRIILTLIFLVGIFGWTKAQQAATFSGAESNGISIDQLDNEYLAALDSDPDKGVFKDRVDSFTKAYQLLLQDLNDYLIENGFMWPGKVRCFNRIYFNAEGGIDYFLYNFMGGQLSKDQEKEFDRLLAAFIVAYKIGMSSNKKFSQCSPVTYQGQ